MPGGLGRGARAPMLMPKHGSDSGVCGSEVSRLSTRGCWVRPTPPKKLFVARCCTSPVPPLVLSRLGLRSPLPPFPVLTSSLEPVHALGMLPRSAHRWHPVDALHDVPSPAVAGSGHSASSGAGRFGSQGGPCPTGSCCRTPAGSTCWIIGAYLWQAQEHRPRRQHGEGAASLQPEVGRSGRARVSHTLARLCQGGRYVGREQNQQTSPSPLVLHQKPNPAVQHRASTPHAPPATHVAPNSPNAHGLPGCAWSSKATRARGDVITAGNSAGTWASTCAMRPGSPGARLAKVPSTPRPPQGRPALPVRRHRARRGQARAAR